MPGFQPRDLFLVRELIDTTGLDQLFENGRPFRIDHSPHHRPERQVRKLRLDKRHAKTPKGIQSVAERRSRSRLSPLFEIDGSVPDAQRLQLALKLRGEIKALARRC